MTNPYVIADAGYVIAPSAMGSRVRFLLELHPQRAILRFAMRWLGPLFNIGKFANKQLQLLKTAAETDILAK